MAISICITLKTCVLQMTYADISMFTLVDILNEHRSEIMSKYAHIQKLYAAVKSQPNIAKWLSERPSTVH